MFNDRDLFILGSGGLLAVFALFLPFPLVGKMIAGVSVLGVFMLAALLRFGPDRVPLEEWLRRRIRFSAHSQRFVFQQRDWQPPANQPTPAPATPAPARSASSVKPRASLLPVDLAFDEIGIYPLVTVFMFVLGVYFVVWLANGGANEIALLFR
jgi:hypothetical protein